MLLLQREIVGVIVGGDFAGEFAVDIVPPHFFATSRFSVTTFWPGSTVTVNPLVAME